MGFYSFWPAILCTALVCGFVALPMFRAADVPPNPSPHRIDTLDGLRGFLALGVFFHHAAYYHSFMVTGSWEIPSTASLGAHGLECLGEVPVELFFMITGFLFWSQMLHARGRPSFLKLYVGRAFRILPLYWLATAGLLVGVAILSRFQLREPPLAVGKEILLWLPGGAVTGPDVNGVAGTSLLLCGVTWTLRYEWMFYAALLVTSVLCRSERLALLASAVGLVVGLALAARGNGQFAVQHRGLVAACLFLSGMTAASLRQRLFRLPGPDWVWSAGVVALVAASLFGFPTAYRSAPIACLAVAFYLVATGTTVFGLLRSRPARRLGDVSYGIYLLQGLVFAGAFAFAPVRAFALSALLAHWCATLVLALVLVGVASIAHVHVERQGIALGARAYRRLQRSLAHLNPFAPDAGPWVG